MKFFPAAFLAVPYWLLLSLLRPWRNDSRVRRFARRSLDAFLWLNTFWAICPVLVVIYLATGELGWMLVVGLFIAAALLLHSAIAHSTESVLTTWEARQPTAHPDEM